MLERTRAMPRDGSPSGPARSSDISWIAGWPQSPREFEALLDYVQDRLVWYAYQHVGELGEAEDVVQDVLVRAYADRNRRANVLAVIPYLYRMVANRCAERYREDRLKPISLEQLPRQPGAMSEQIEAVEQLHWVQQLLSRLPATQAEAVRLRILDDLPLADVARTVGCSLSTAKSRLHYGLQRLRRMIPTLADAAEHIREVTSMHIAARMRTLAHENFDYIDLKAPLIPLDIWTQASDPPKWRVEKESRCAVMDGEFTKMVAYGEVAPTAFRQRGFAVGMVGWLEPLLDVGTLLEYEQRLAAKYGFSTNLKRMNGADGRLKTVLTVRAKPIGDLTQSDYLKNTSVWDSDNVRVYTFDSESQRLEEIGVSVETAEGSVTAFETTRIDYSEPVDPAKFVLKIPDDAAWFGSPKLPPEAPDTSQMTPEEVAQALFEACATSDWKQASVFDGSLADNTKLREWLGGLEILSIGKAFRSGSYAGWFVPYKIRLRSGQTKGLNLAVRNDHPSAPGQWMVDGGI